MTRRPGRILSVASLLVLAACTAVPPSLRLAPEDGGLARRVARLASRARCRMGIVALHVESGRRLEWNASEAFEGASVVKLALLVEAAARQMEGRLDLGARWTLSAGAKAAPHSFLNEFEPGLQPTERDLLRVMIALSDNTAANHFIDLFGADAVNRRMASLGLDRIELVGRIPDLPPDGSLDVRWKGLRLSSMTPAATASLLERAFTGRLLGGEGDTLIRETLAAQRSLDRLPRLFLDRPGVKWAGKTGTMPSVRTDSGVLTTAKGRFVLVAFADRIPEGGGPRANQAMSEIAAAIVNTWSTALPDVVPSGP